MKKTFNKGFTLIELLVVIAIIGILSSVVLVSLNGARTKATGAKATSEMSQVMTAVEMAISDGCTAMSITSGSAIKCTTGADTTTEYIKTAPAQPTGFTYNFVTSALPAYTISATFPGTSGDKFICSGGTCACYANDGSTSKPAGCKQ